MEMLITGFGGPFFLLVHLSPGKDRAEEQGCVPLPRGINFSGSHGQADWEPSYTLNSTALPAGADLCVFLPS